MKLKISLLFTVLTLSLCFGAFSPAEAQTNRPRNQQSNAAATNAPAPEINFTIGMSKPWTHLLEVEMRLRGNLGQQTEIVMPVWTPGSYLVREYARHVMDFAAKNASGNNLAWEKTNKNTWQIQTGGANEIVVTYNVYSNELTVRTNELNDEHAFITPAALFMHPKGHINAPSTVRVVPYRNWKVATGLPPVAGQTNTFRAADFDILYDSPFEVSDFKEFTFTSLGKPHRFVIDGDGNYDIARFQRDIPKIVEASAAIFGNELPFENYLFITNLRGGGGLEHLNSTALQWNRFGFTGPRYNGYLSLVAHEFFHLWNVKRIRPDVLGPFDYSNENYTKLLWVAEGGTDYYASLIMLRAGFISDGQFLMQKAAAIGELQERPGRFQTSVEEASFDAWIKNYRPDENSINREISYYDKGDIVMMMLDLEIRRSSGGAKSMDDVMRFLNNEFAKKNRNYTPQDFQRIAEQHAGKSLEEFFRKYVSGREEIDYNSIFQSFGIRLETAVPGARPQATLGANLSQTGDRLTVSTIPAGTAAYQQGLNTGDQIVAIDGMRASQQFLNSYLAEKRPGDKIRLTVFRFDDLRDIEITLGSEAPEQFRFVAVQNPTSEQRRLYRGWLGADLR
ncbi:MAG: PDZ domain-containing protein [Acidobacteriota bacterium]|nr:PDZ domain-containing protein [Acidobacteriota bacterium]